MMEYGSPNKPELFDSHSGDKTRIYFYPLPEIESRMSISEGRAEFHMPSIEEMISLELPYEGKASSDGGLVAYTVRTTNWTDNRYEHKLHLYNSEKESSHQLTRIGNVKEFHWLDGDRILILREDSPGDVKPQVWLFEDLAGEPVQITDHETGVESFTPFTGGILYIADEPSRKEKKERSERYGNFTHWEQEESPSALYYTSIERMVDHRRRLKTDHHDKPVEPVVEISRALGKPLKILSVHPSPRHEAVYVNCRSKDYLVYWNETRIYQLKMNPESVLEKKMEEKDCGNGSAATELINVSKLGLPSGASIVAVSPDGSKLLIAHRERDQKLYTQADYWTIDLKEAGKLKEDLTPRLRKISGKLDYGRTTLVAWVEAGIYVAYTDGTKGRVARLTESGEKEELDLGGIYPMYAVDVSDGGFVSFTGTNAERFPEVYVSRHPLEGIEVELLKLTSLGEQVEGWDIGKVETVRWNSKDGIEIEGVLRKPTYFDSSRRYPLLFDVHGGPSAVSREFLFEPYDFMRYPVVQFNNLGVLILKPNYRGSTGYGQAFLELNVDNLGVGDLWDLEGGIDHLSAQGFIDEERVGCMGWSQGGYISAMVATHSDRFCATSVGAGIADWYTYHVSNDIPHFTTHYLSGSPFRGKELYRKTSPMTAIERARTPTLIQHGVKDQRVPFSNATELYRGLREMGVPVELYAFTEMGHSIDRPRECRAVMEQNLSWFSHFLLGEELNLPK